MTRTGIYFTDASFDKKTKVYSIGIIEKTTGNSLHYQGNDLGNIYEAELKGIKNAIKDAIEKKFDNLIIFCDNQRAVKEARRELFKRVKNIFNSVQFVWLPREFMYEADFLSKNIEDHESNIRLKQESCEKKNVLDLFVSKSSIQKIAAVKTRDLELEKICSKEECPILYGIRSFEFPDLTRDSERLSKELKTVIERDPKQAKPDSALNKVLSLLYSAE